jgi:hypothetical protein
LRRVRGNLAAQHVGEVQRHRSQFLSVASAERRTVHNEKDRMAEVQAVESRAAEIRISACARHGVEPIGPSLDAHEVAAQQGHGRGIARRGLQARLSHERDELDLLAGVSQPLKAAVGMEQITRQSKQRNAVSSVGQVALHQFCEGLSLLSIEIWRHFRALSVPVSVSDSVSVKCHL